MISSLGTQYHEWSSGRKEVRIRQTSLGGARLYSRQADSKPLKSVDSCNQAFQVRDAEKDDG